MLDGSISDSQLESGVGTSANNLVKLDANAKLPAGVSVISESFESAEITYTDAAQSVEVSHGLSSVPKIFQFVARCKTADGGYAVGDELDFSAPKYVNATKIGFVTFGPLYLPNKSNSAGFNPNASSWKLVLRAFA
jgi:hypothetical protein